MMTMDEITKQVRMSRQGAAKMLHKAGVKKMSVPFAHGRKHCWDITPQRLLEIKEAQYKPRIYNLDRVIAEQSICLARLEAAFAMGGHRGRAG